MNSNLAQSVPAVTESIVDNNALTFVVANSDQLATHQSTFTFPRREMIILASVLVFLQMADGLLTGIGVSHMGIEMEANPLLRMLMGIFGLVPTLIAVKAIAISVIAILASLSGIVPWITLAFRGMVALYTLVAVLPWSAILYGYFAA
jgi:hypothetical protein